MPSSLSNRLLTCPSHPSTECHGWAPSAHHHGRLVTPARAPMLVHPVAAHGQKQGEDVDTASDACAEGGTGRPHRREGPAHALPRQPPTAVGARAACACQMSRERTNGVQTRGTEENGLGVSARGPAAGRAWSLKIIRKGLPRPAASDEGQARGKGQGVEASLTRRHQVAVRGLCPTAPGDGARRRPGSDTGRYGMILWHH